MWLHLTKSPLQNWYLNHFILSIGNSLIIETFEKKSYRKRKRLYNKDTHGISNHLFKNY